MLVNADVFAPFYAGGSVIVASLGLGKTAYLYVYCIDLIYGCLNPFFPYDYWDLRCLPSKL